MNDPILSIGDVAARTGRSLHAIRWYESQGLLPGVCRDEGGRRRYTAQHVACLELMERLRVTGMSIAQMLEFTTLVDEGNASLGRRRTLLAEHLNQVRETIARWNERLALINAKLEFYDGWLVTGERPAYEPSVRVARIEAPSLVISLCQRSGRKE